MPDSAIQTSARLVHGFDQIVLRGSGEVTVTLANEEGVTVSAPTDRLSRVQTEVIDDKLLLHVDLSWWDKLRPEPDHPAVTFQVQARSLRGLTLEGSGRIHVDRVVTHNMQIAMDGSGRLVIDDLVAETLEAAMVGSGQLDLSGRVDEQWVTIQGVGVFDGMGLDSRRASVRISGEGKASVHANEALDAEIAGGGEVVYGGGAQLSQVISGDGRIRRLEGGYG